MHTTVTVQAICLPSLPFLIDRMKMIKMKMVDGGAGA